MGHGLGWGASVCTSVVAQWGVWDGRLVRERRSGAVARRVGREGRERACALGLGVEGLPPTCPPTHAPLAIAWRSRA